MNGNRRGLVQLQLQYLKQWERVGMSVGDLEWMIHILQAVKGLRDRRSWAIPVPNLDPNPNTNPKPSWGFERRELPPLNIFLFICNSIQDALAPSKLTRYNVKAFQDATFFFALLVPLFFCYILFSCRNDLHRFFFFPKLLF